MFKTLRNFNNLFILCKFSLISNHALCKQDDLLTLNALCKYIHFDFFSA